MKKVLLVMMMSLLVLAGCSSDKPETEDKTKDEEVVEKEKTEESSEPTLGDTIEFDDLEIVLGDSFELVTLENEFSDKNGTEVIKVPITVTNKKDDTHGLNMFYVSAYGSQGTKLDDISTYYMEEDVTWTAGSSSLRSGASIETYIHFIYDGDGDYYLTFEDFSDKVEYKIPVSK